MPITTLDGFIAAARQRVVWAKTATRTTVAGGWFSLIDVAGNPGAGTLAGTDTTAGTVPDGTTAGVPAVAAFGGGATGYLSRAWVANTVISQVRVFDLLWKGGAYAFNANTSGNTPAGYLSRIPGGTAADCAGQTEIWAETVVAATGSQTWSVQYTNTDGVTGRATPVTGVGAAPTVGRCWQLPLAPGDKGVSAVTGVLGSTGSAGSANILVLRPLLDVYVGAASGDRLLNLFDTGMPQVFDATALFVLVNAPSGTSSGLPNCFFDISNG